MGAVSSCCAVEGAEDKQLMKEGDVREDRSAQPGQGSLKKERSLKEGKSQKKTKEKSNKEQSKTETVESVATPEEVTSLKGRLKNGMSIIVLLQDGTQLSCNLQLNETDRSMNITCEDKVRVIPLSDIKTVFSKREQLELIDNKADLAEDKLCVAIHLLESGNCIPLRFENETDKTAFAQVVRELKKGDGKASS